MEASPRKYAFLSLRACYPPPHLNQTTRILQITVKAITNLSLNLQGSLFSIIWQTHFDHSLFLAILLFWKDSTTKGIIQSFVPYFFRFILFMQARVGGGFQRSYKPAFYRILSTQNQQATAYEQQYSASKYQNWKRWNQTQSPQFFSLAFSSHASWSKKVIRFC